MEDDGEGSSPGTPFWVKSSGGSRRQISSIFLNSGILIVFLCLSAVFTILFIIPWFLSLTSQILRPNLVKKSWDWFNAVLIILALIFGFLSRNMNADDEDRTALSAQKSQSTLFHWDDRGASNASIRTQKLHDNWYENGSGSFGLKRNSSSYPDLRDMTFFLHHRRFMDDTHVENSRVMVDSDQVRRRRERTEVGRDLGSDGSKEIYIDTETTIRKEVNLTQTPSPTGRELRDAKQKRDPDRKQVMGHSEKAKNRWPSLMAAELPEKKKSSSKGERKRGGTGGTATKEFINSFYHQSKKKKNQRAKSLDNFESLLGNHDLSVPPPPANPPSPPPPPPRTSVFQNILSTKKRKPRKIISVPAPPPPPPLPTKTERKPLFPAKRIDSNKAVKTHKDSAMAIMGSESPVNPIPPPPPPPPFKMPSWKFVVQGDYVRVGSFNSSISEHESSDADERESPTSEVSNTDSSGTHTTAGAGAAPSRFCPSPDVNTKAEMFIARFRAGLQLQKINSLEQKQRLGMSNLGPQAQSHDQAQAQAQIRE